jgi:hypothetical protein
MKSIRTLLAGPGAIFMAVAIAAPALAQSCLQPAEQSAFQVRALQSQLMVAAIACGQQDDYNAFVTRFQGDLGGAWRSLAGHFRRTGGRQHQKQLDSYITHLANAQSQDGIRQGSRFCQNLRPLFQVAMSQPNVGALAQLATERNIINPLEAPSCAAAPATTTPSTRRTRRPAGQRTAAAQSR